MACFLSLHVFRERREVAPPGAAGTVFVPITAYCRLHCQATHIIPVSCQRRALVRVLMAPKLTHLGQAGKVLILVLL